MAEYGKLHDYALELEKSNEGTTTEVVVDDDNADKIPNFKAFYVCFKACKEGWKDGCRPMIGIDGCLLKHRCKGQSLAAVGRDGKNQMFAIAWPIVDLETKKTWKWFLEHLVSDLKIADKGQGL